MFRIGLKFPCNGLNRVKKHGCARLYLTARYYDTRARVKSEPEGRFFKDDKLMSRFSGHKYSTESSKSGKARSVTAIAFGVVTVGTIGILSLVKESPALRTTLEGWIPGTDKTIRIIFQEDATYFELIRTFFETLKLTILEIIFGNPSDKEQGQKVERKLDCKNLKDYIPPKPAFEPLVDKKESPVNEPYAEIRLSNEKGEEIEVVAEKPSPPPKDIPAVLMPENLVELEANCGQAAAKAIAAYEKAACAIQDYNQDVLKVIESSTISAGVWERLKEATEKRKVAIKEAETHVNETTRLLKQMYNYIDDSKLEAPAHMKTVAKRNIKKILDDVGDAQKKFEDELNSANVTERYWKQVKAAREHFNEELQILFPNVNINEKKLSVGEEAFDLFVLHMYHKVNNMQKELAKLQTVNEAKIRAALKASGEHASEEKLNAMICLEVQKEKRLLEEEFNKKLLAEQKRLDEEMRRQLKLQTQVHVDHLREAVLAKEREAERMVNRALSEQAESESIRHKTQLAAVVGRLRGLEAAIKARLDQEKGATNAQMLWSACQALARAVKVAPPGTAADTAVRPLEPEIKAVTKAAPKEDPLVRAAIRGIPEEASKRGVFPEDALRERFLKVENVARRLALVPEEGAGLPIYLLSYLQSFLIVKTANPIPKSELTDEPINAEALNTFDILNRARYWLDRGDFKMTLRYMNLLKGAPRSIAREWMNEVRILLETQQAVDTLLAYAGATGLVFLGAGDSAKVSRQS